MKILLACFLYACGHIISWLLNHSQFVWDWWSDKQFITCLVYSIPASMLFWHGTKYAYEGLGQAWSARLLAFGISYLIFPILTFLLLGESMLTIKTMSCIALSIAIVCIQIFF